MSTQQPPVTTGEPAPESTQLAGMNTNTPYPAANAIGPLITLSRLCNALKGGIPSTLLNIHYGYCISYLGV